MGLAQVDVVPGFLQPQDIRPVHGYQDERQTGSRRTTSSCMKEESFRRNDHPYRSGQPIHIVTFQGACTPIGICPGHGQTGKSIGQYGQRFLQQNIEAIANAWSKLTLYCTYEARSLPIYGNLLQQKEDSFFIGLSVTIGVPASHKKS